MGEGVQKHKSEGMCPPLPPNPKLVPTYSTGILYNMYHAMFKLNYYSVKLINVNNNYYSQELLIT